MEFKQIDPRVISLWRIQALLRALLFWAPMAFGVWWIFSDAGLDGLGALLGGLAMVTAIGVALYWPALVWRHISYALTDGEVIVRRGVLFRRSTAIPYCRVQHVDTHQGPIEQLFHLAQVHLFTASGVSADAVIPGLGEALSEELRDELAVRAGLDAIADGV